MERLYCRHTMQQLGCESHSITCVSCYVYMAIKLSIYNAADRTLLWPTHVQRGVWHCWCKRGQTSPIQLWNQVNRKHPIYPSERYYNRASNDIKPHWCSTNSGAGSSVVIRCSLVAIHNHMQGDLLTVREHAA